ncbi:hypothetical protein BHM03_00059134 [Ensete ventricosum]|nr:hypothetical protein BHM03_00059134 [Ensete ventricosum]
MYADGSMTTMKVIIMVLDLGSSQMVTDRMVVPRGEMESSTNLVRAEDIRVSGTVQTADSHYVVPISVTNSGTTCFAKGIGKHAENIGRLPKEDRKTRCKNAEGNRIGRTVFKVWLYFSEANWGL